MPSSSECIINEWFKPIDPLVEIAPPEPGTVSSSENASSSSIMITGIVLLS